MSGNLNTIEDAKAAIQESEALIKELDTFSDNLFDLFKNEFGEVKDFPSFKNVFINYINECPNHAIIEGYGTEDNAKKLWNKININKSGTLDKTEEKLLFKAIIAFNCELIKKHFGL